MTINPFKSNELIELEKNVIKELQAGNYENIKKICTEGILLAKSNDEKADEYFFTAILEYYTDKKKERFLFNWNDVQKNNKDIIKFLKDKLNVEWIKDEYLFNWNDVQKEDIIKFLKDKLNVEWIKNAPLFEDSEIVVEKENDTIKVTRGKNLAVFKLDISEKQVNLKIGEKIYKYAVIEDKDKLNVYEQLTITKEKNKIIVSKGENFLEFKYNKTKGKVILKINGNIYTYDAKKEGENLNVYEEKKDAVELLREAIRIEERFVFAYYVLGFIYNELKEYELAKDAFTKCIEIDENFADAYFDLGVVLKNMGNFVDAINSFKKALKFYEKTNYSRAIDTNWWIKNIEGLKGKEKIRSAEENVIDTIVEDLRDRKERLFRYINEKEDKFKNFISAKKTITQDKNFIIVLRRWNSYTPALSSDIERRKGGGYFLSWNGHGIVIDPGFNFIENFFSNGFVISDIDAIFISHSHLDHTSDFESLMTLIFERNDNLPPEEKKQIDLFLNFSSMSKFSNLLSLDKSAIRKIYILQPGIAIDLTDKYGFILLPTKAKHRELWGNDLAVGFIFEFIDNNKKKFKLGMTIDTGYTDEIGSQFKGSDILFVHIGSIKEKEFDLNLDLNERLYKNHLGLIGTTKIIKDAFPKLAVISEFGEELGSLRVDISKAIEGVVKDRRIKRCLPGDIGMKISLPDMKIRCDMCSKEKREDIFVDMNEINAIYFPEEVPGDPGKLIYICKKHF